MADYGRGRTPTGRHNRPWAPGRDFSTLDAEDIESLQRTVGNQAVAAETVIPPCRPLSKRSDADSSTTTPKTPKMTGTIAQAPSIDNVINRVRNLAAAKHWP